MPDITLSDRPRVIVAVGLPGSGKSTYFSGAGVTPISSDAIRILLIDDEANQTINSRVFTTLRYLLHHRLELNRPETYIDATNLTRKDRKPFIKMARDHGAQVDALWFDVPLALCKRRNASRGRVVPEFAMDQMAAKLIPPSIEEGFDAVIVP